MTWLERAACAGKPTEWFFPSRSTQRMYADGKRVCAACPVRVECLDAGRDEPVGLWGGLSPGERLGRAGRAVQRRATPVWCVVCGVVVPDSGHGPRRRYCGQVCAWRARYRRMKAV